MINPMGHKTGDQVALPRFISINSPVVVFGFKEENVSAQTRKCTQRKGSCPVNEICARSERASMSVFDCEMILNRKLIHLQPDKIGWENENIPMLERVKYVSFMSWVLSSFFTAVLYKISYCMGRCSLGTLLYQWIFAVTVTVAPMMIFRIPNDQHR